jgi:hypothetical protein
VLVKSLFLLANSAKTVKIISMTKLISKKRGLFLVLSAAVDLISGVIRDPVLLGINAFRAGRRLRQEARQVDPGISSFLPNGPLRESQLII